MISRARCGDEGGGDVGGEKIARVCARNYSDAQFIALRFKNVNDLCSAVYRKIAD